MQILDEEDNEVYFLLTGTSALILWLDTNLVRQRHMSLDQLPRENAGIFPRNL